MADLKSALECAISEPDLVADIIEACRLSNTSASDLAGWSLEDIASKLFLTEAEAQKLSDVCKAACEGDVSALDSSKQQLNESVTAEGAAAAAERDSKLPVHEGGHEQGGEEHQQQYQEEEGGAEAAAGEGAEAQEEQPVERTPEPEDRQEEQQAFQTPYEHSSNGGEAKQEQEEGQQQEEVGTDQHHAEQAHENGEDKAAQQADAGVPMPSSSVSPPRTRSMSKRLSSSMSKSRDSSQLPAAEPSDSLPTFKEDNSARVPSYLRATTSYKAHTGKLPQPERSPSPDAPGTGSRPSSTRKANTASSRLLAPTASYLTRITSARKDSKAAREAAEAAEREKKAKELKKVMESPQGQRVTKAQPFQFRTPQEHINTVRLTSEERAYLEAQKSAWKRHEVPKHIKEHRPIEGVRVHSAPKSPQDIQKPFQLASLEKHEKYRKMAEQRQAEQKRKEEEERRFRAQQLDKTILEQPQTPKPRSPPPVTQSQDFKLRSEERVKLHKTVLDPAKRSRMSQAEREKLEAHERAIYEQEMKEKEAKAAAAAAKQRERELMNMDVSEYRKSLTFKASGMPNFSNPFRVDLSKSQRVTDSIEFNFHTDKKLGKPKSPHERDDLAAPKVNANHFGSSLRASTNQIPNMRSSMRGSMRDSMRGSMRGSLRESADVRRQSANALRSSTSSLPLSAQRPGSARPASAKVAGSRLSSQNEEVH